MNNHNNRALNRKKKSMALMLVLSVLLLISGTFAWRDYRQHKSNVLSGKGLTRDVVLIEEFNPEDGEHWVAKDDKGNTGAVKKKVSVENRGQSGVVVRLSLKEYMETDTSVDSEVSNLRYMIDSAGNYIKVKATPEMANDASIVAEKMNEKLSSYPEIQKIVGEFDEYDVADSDNNDLDEDYRIHKLASFATESESDDGLYYYIATQANDPNGQYGKYITFGKGSIDLEADAKSENIITGGGTEAIKVRPDASIDHHATNEDNPSMKEQCDLFEVINAGRVSKESKEHAAKYVELGFNENNVELTYDATKDYEEGKWVQQGDYFYYSIILEPGTNTGTLLESLILKEQPKGAFIYQSHIDLEAVSFDEIADGEWDGVDVSAAFPKIFENWSRDHEDGENVEHDQSGIVEIDTIDGPVNFIIMFEEGDNLYLLSENFITYNGKDTTTYQGSGDYAPYEESVLKSFVDGWYHHVLSDDMKDMVLDSKRIGMDGPDEIDIYQGVQKDQNFANFQNEVKYRNIVDVNQEGKQKVFAPSVSDINYSINEKGLNINDWNKLKGNSELQMKPWWTSSPANIISYAAIVNSEGIQEDSDSKPLHARVAMWVPKSEINIK